MKIGLTFGQPFFAPHSLRFIAELVGISLVYFWLYWVQTDSSIADAEDQADTALNLSRRGEQIRWRLASVAMYTILLEILVCDVKSWGIYAAIMIGVAGYFTGDIGATGFGGYERTKNQRIFVRRITILPALLVFFKGTDFVHGNLVCTFVLSCAIVCVLLLLLVPEPAE